MPIGRNVKLAVVAIWALVLILLVVALTSRSEDPDEAAEASTSEELASCVAYIRAGAASMADLLADGESIDDVDQATLERLCREQVLPAQEAARATSTSSPPVDVAASCDAAMATAAAEPDSTAAQPLIEATLSSCSTASEWLAALRLHPAAMGVAGPEYISEMDLQIVCSADGVAGTPVCADARAAGLL